MGVIRSTTDTTITPDMRQSGHMFKKQGIFLVSSMVTVLHIHINHASNLLIPKTVNQGHSKAAAREAVA